MKLYNLNKMKQGWFIGNFFPTSYKTKHFEVSYKVHRKNEKWPQHYHKKSDEINLIIKGKMKIRKRILKTNDIFILKKKELADPKFFLDTHIICVKVPSATDDKYCAKTHKKLSLNKT